MISYTLYDAAAADASAQTILGQYRTNFDQACFPLVKVQVMVPRPGKDTGEFPNEAPYKGRYLLCVLENYLKMIDT